MVQVMKIGRETGSVTNMVMSAWKGEEPKVGMGVTMLWWTDRYPGTIVEVDCSKKRPIIAVQTDHAKRTDSNGMSEMQSYDYSPDPDAEVLYFRQEENGTWFQITRNPKTGRWNKRRMRCVVGHREKYHDFCF